MEIYMFKVEDFENLSRTEYKGFFVCSDHIDFAVGRFKNLEYCNWFIDNTKRITN